MKRFSVSIPDDLYAKMKLASDQRLDRPSSNQLVREALAFYLPTVVTTVTETANGRNGQPCAEPAQ